MCNLFGRIGGDADLSERGLKVCCKTVVEIIVMYYIVVSQVALWPNG